MLTKCLISAIGIAVIGAGVAYANPASDTRLDLVATGSPFKSGTKSKPRAVTLRLTAKSSTKSGAGQPETTKRIIITLPRRWVLNARRWPRSLRCHPTLANRRKSDKVCPRGSKVGSGRADLLAANGTIKRVLAVQIYVVSNGTLGFWVQSRRGEAPNVAQMLRSRARRRSVVVYIPSNLQRPLGVKSSIASLRVRVGRTARIKGRRRGIIESRGCKRRWPVKLTLDTLSGRVADTSRIKCRRR